MARRVREGADPLAVTFLSADEVFVLPVFLSLSNSVLHSIHFLFFLSTRLYFSGKDKNVEHKEDQASKTESPRHRLDCCVSVLLQFSVGAVGSKSLTRAPHSGACRREERREGEAN